MGNTQQKLTSYSLDDTDPENPQVKFPKEYKELIFNKLVLPYYNDNIEYEIKSKDGWSKVSIAFLSISTFLIGGSSLLSFACGFYPNNVLNFIAGSVGLLSIMFKEFATYANSIDHIKTLTLNELLKNIDINHSFIDTSTNYKLAIDRKSQGLQTSKKEPNINIDNDTKNTINNAIIQALTQFNIKSKNDVELSTISSIIDQTVNITDKQPINKTEQLSINNTDQLPINQLNNQEQNTKSFKPKLKNAKLPTEQLGNDILGTTIQEL
jgi:hypothetical protein